MFSLAHRFLPAMQEELTVLTSQQQQLAASEAASRQQLALSEQAREQASAACASAEAELHHLSTVLQDSQAQLALAHQNEAQVISTHQTPTIAASGLSHCTAHTGGKMHTMLGTLQPAKCSLLARSLL